MKYILVILITLSCISVRGQIADTQFAVDTTGAGDLRDSLMFLTNNLEHSTRNWRFRLSDWQKASVIAPLFAPYIAPYVTDLDWIKQSTLSTVPTNTDSMYHNGYMLLKGLSGGLPTKIEMLKDGVLQFDKDSSSDTRSESYIRFNPLQKTHNNLGFEFVITSAPNANGPRNNSVVEFGFGAGNTFVSGEPGVYWSMEDWYQPTAGNDYSEVHLKVRDKTGAEHRPITLFLDHDVPANWTTAYESSIFEFRDPTNSLPNFQFNRVSTTGARFKILASASAQGAYFEVNPAASTFQIVPESMTDSELIMKGFEYAETKRLQITTAFGNTSNKLWGESSGGWHEKITTGYGIDLTSDVLLVDTSQVATPYDLTLLSGGDDWGSDVVNHDNTLTGNGTSGSPLKVDSSKIATQYDISGFMSNWLLAASGTGSTESITNGETFTVTAGTGITATRLTNNITITNTGDTNVADDITAHSALTGLTSGDDHTQYALLAGRAGGQTLTGGTGNNDDLIFKTTTGTGSSTSLMQFLVGTNGGTTAATILNTGKFGIGTTGPDKIFELNLGTADAQRWTYNDGDGSAATFMDGTISSAGLFTFNSTGSAPSFSFSDKVFITGSGANATSLAGSDASGFITYPTLSSGLSFVGNVFTVADQSASNEFQTLGGVGTGTDYTCTLSNTGGSFKFIEGGGIAFISPTNGLNSILTIEAVDQSETNEIQTLTLTGSSPYTFDLSGTGSDIVVQAGTGITLSESPANTLVITNSGSADGNGIYSGDGTTPADVDVTVTDSISFDNGTLFIDAISNTVGIGIEAPQANLHQRSASGTNFMLEKTSADNVVWETKTRQTGAANVASFKWRNRDTDIDISGDQYQVASMDIVKTISNTAGGRIDFSVGYDSSNLDQVLTVNSRIIAASPTMTDGYVGLAGGLQYKFETNTSTSISPDFGKYGITCNNASAVAVTLPVIDVAGRSFYFANIGAGVVTITRGGSNTIQNGSSVNSITVNQYESVTITAITTTIWDVIN